MKTTVIACKTLEDEINQAVEKTGKDYSMIWVEAGLHYYPDKLKATLQDTINSVKESDYILLLFGLCGNALLGLNAKAATLVIPKVDDCISLLLGGNEARKAIEHSSKAYYLTQGWLRFDINIWYEYQRTLKLYGPEKTRTIFKMMLNHYNHLVLIDTGVHDASFLEKTKMIAEELNLKHQIVPGDTSYLFAALKGEWGEQFLLIEPGQTVTPQLMGNCTQ